MSLKQEIETWVGALAFYDNNEFDEALGAFDNIADTSKILFNCGVIHATLGEHEKAVDCYIRAIKLDNYLAVAYFQQGVSNFLMGDFEEALANFNDTLLYLRGNNNIDYEQLGLKFKLFSCEVLFNRGLCYIYLQQLEQGMQDLIYAAKEKVVPDHDVIEEAIKEQAEGYTVFSIPVGIVYRPNEAKVKNLKAKDYLGKARLVASTDRQNQFTGFAGAELKRLNGPQSAKDDRPEDKLSYAAANLVRTDLRSRSRQHSEPSLSRNVFPPTPPPESDKSHTSPRSSRTSGGRPLMSRGDSVKAGPKPKPLDLTVAGFAGLSGRTRTQSERPGPRNSVSESSKDLPPAPSRSNTQRAPPPRRPSRDEDHGYPEDVYEMYGNRGRETYISEEEEDGSDSYINSYDEAEFEMLPSLPQQMRRGSTRRGPAMKKIRVKVHADDTRYVLVGSAVEFKDFVNQIRAKFGIRQAFKIKIKDENDMITMADQEDLEMAVETAKSGARREKSDMGKMEVWIQAV
ncbi:NADPH oxidase regulator [Venturia nashicola]|uniref:NADPH oxidase regulator n=1 Tax=Venturia nashicola TaxID=86259 RepID=A0A4Z1P856_9PEZI|nr:NADPH oxidase regulator [Venturia nashicola]TLD37597.1 NADPH oxidase regulator [Venturia nashicola]